MVIEQTQAPSRGECGQTPGACVKTQKHTLTTEPHRLEAFIGNTRSAHAKGYVQGAGQDSGGQVPHLSGWGGRGRTRRVRSHMETPLGGKLPVT